MSYNPVTDFLALARLASGAVSFGKMPGMDFVVSAMARAGLFKLYVGQSAPLADQATTVWLKPSVPAWVAEGTVWLWNADTADYELATPALWAQILNPAGGARFQFSQSPAVVISNSTTLFAVGRNNPAATAVQLPSVYNRGGKALQIVDWSTHVAAHQIALTPVNGETVMQRNVFNLVSTADQLSGVTIYPSTDLVGWVVAP